MVIIIMTGDIDDVEMFDYHRLLVLKDVMDVIKDSENIEAARRELNDLIEEASLMLT
jgi:hypothetical protein